MAALGEGLPIHDALEPLKAALAASPCAVLVAPPGRRKIVLATSIAETSLTIEGARRR